MPADWREAPEDVRGLAPGKLRQPPPAPTSSVQPGHVAAVLDDLNDKTTEKLDWDTPSSI
jgi:hypothetical protein